MSSANDEHGARAINGDEAWAVGGKGVMYAFNLLPPEPHLLPPGPPSPFLSWGVIWERTRVICERTQMQEEDRDSRDREFIDEVRESVEWFTAVDIEVRHETHDDRLCMSSCAMC